MISVKKTQRVSSAGAWVQLWPWLKQALKEVPFYLHADQSLIRSYPRVEGDLSGGYCSDQSEPQAWLGMVGTVSC